MAARKKAQKQDQAFLPGLADDPPAAADATTAPQWKGTVTNSPETALPADIVAEAEQNGAADAVTRAPGEEPTIDTADPPDMTGKTVWVIDANSLIFQVFHAIPEMTSPKGQPVNAVFGFTRDLLYLLDVKKPDYIIAAFDLGEPTFRHTQYEGYKATRSECPVELSPQFPLIRQMIAALNIPVLEHPQYEADDVLATIARITEEQGGDCFVVSADKDCRQLLSDRVKIYNLRKNQIYDATVLATDWGVRPDQVVDFQALVGDSVDNVPGVPQIGPKAAKDLLDKYQTLDGIYEHVEEITAAARKKTLVENKDKAYLSRDLVRLEKYMPLAVDWRTARVRGIDAAAAVALCTELGFHRLTQQMRNLPAATPAPKAPAAAWVVDYQTIDTPEKLANLATDMAAQSRLSVDTETTAISPTMAELVGLSAAWSAGVGYYVPVKGPAGETVLPLAEVVAALKPVLENPAIAKVGQNLKYDQIVLRGVGIDLAGVAFDTLLAAYLLDAGERNHNLDELAQRYLNHTNITIESLIGSGKNQRTIDQASIADVTKYAAEDADVALRLVDLLEPKLADQGLTELFRTVEMPLVQVLVDLESTGIRVDPIRLGELSERYTARMAELEQEIYKLAGREFNIASPKQLATILFDELRLPVISKTKTGPSTDADVLEELGRRTDLPGHKLPAKIIEFRQYAKLKGTYVDALPQLVNPRTGRVHCSLHQAVAATGRLSSSDPNLQNIPIRTEEGREIRSAFLPGRDDWMLVSADYSQIELRLLAHCSEDPGLLASFAAGEDIHTRVAGQVYGVPLEQVTRDQRRTAKTVNFGILYGQSAFGLAKVLGIPQEEASTFIEGYFAQYPGVERFMNGVLETCAKQGYVSTIMGRRRAVNGVRTTGGRQRNLAERTAINTVIQGSAADLIKLAMINVHRKLRDEFSEARMLLQIHDELLFETPTGEQDRLIAMVRDEMQTVLTLRVPLQVDVKVGKNWAETEAV
jgi:DNA polymerase-1